MSAKKRILIVDDERHIVEFLVMNLRQNQYESLIAYDGHEAVNIARAEVPDLILLDSMLPGMSGIETCRTLKQDERTRRIPIIFLTAKKRGKRQGHRPGLGADDYITKPFGLRELFARIEAVLRRSSQDSPPLPRRSTFASRISRYALKASPLKKGRKDPLVTQRVFLLAILARNADKVVGKKELMESLAPGSEATEGRSLDVHLRNLRKKLGESPRAEGYIDTVRGFGLKANS